MAYPQPEIKISQSVAVLIDGNNIERSIHTQSGDDGAMLNFDTLIAKLLSNRSLNRLIYFREGTFISEKLAERLHNHYYGSVRPCHKSADIPLSIKATQLASKVDTIIIMSGDSDYIELVRHLKNEGVRVEIAAIEDNTSQVLKEEADYFHPITEEDWFTLQTKKQQVQQPWRKPKKLGRRSMSPYFNQSQNQNPHHQQPQQNYQPPQTQYFPSGEISANQYETTHFPSDPW